jgi:ssDNA-binding replication factor A large subunit
MDLEQIVERILSSRRDVTHEELLKAIRTKTAASGGFLTEAAAARLVAAEHGVEVKLKRPLPKIRIRQLLSGLNDVTVSGRVLHVSTPREYEHQRGSGQMAKLLIGDETGVLTVVLWDDQVGFAERIKPRQIVRVTHGYVRSSRDGGVELHVGKRGDIQLSPPDASENDFPQVEGFCRKIATLGPKTKRVVVEGVIQALFPVSSFKRRDGTEGKVLRAAIEDDSGRVQAVFWNEKAETAASTHEGEAVLLVNVKVRKSRQDGALELHADEASSMEVTSRPRSFLRIGDLREGMAVRSLTGTVATKPLHREVTTRSGERVAVASFELEDSSGRVWVSVWRGHVKNIEGLTVGARVRLEDVFVRRGFGKQLEVTTRASSSIETPE